MFMWAPDRRPGRDAGRCTACCCQAEPKSEVVEAVHDQLRLVAEQAGGGALPWGPL